MRPPSEEGEASDRPSALLERGPQLAVLRDVVHHAATGDGRWALLQGEAGVGKTSLVAAARRIADQAGITVLHAQADHLESAMPWGVVLQLLAHVPHAEDADLLDDLPAARLRPLLLGDGEPPTATGDPLPLLHAIHWLVADLVDRRPHLLVVDDVHWADASSLRALCYLARRLEGAAASVVLAMRPGEPVDEEVEALLARLAADPSVSPVAVLPLADGSIDDLVARVLPAATPAFRTAVVGAVGGNPFLCREVVEAVRAEGLAPDDRAARRLRDLRPTGVRNAILLRMVQLGPDAARLATAAAVLGPHATLGVARRVAGLDAPSAATALHRLLDAGVLVPGPTLAFAHAIVREAVLTDVGGARIRHDHTAAARELAGQGAPPEEVAAHLVRGDPVEEAWALAALRSAAASHVARAAPQQAVPLLRTALAAASDPDERLGLLRALGDVETATGDPAAVSRFEEAARITGDREDPTVLLHLGDALYAAGRFAEATRAYERGLHACTRPSDGRPWGPGIPVVEARLLAGLDSAARRESLLDHPLRARVAALVADPPPTPDAAERVLLAAAAGRHALAGDLHRDRVVAVARTALAGELPLALGRLVLEPVTAALMICDELDAALGLLDRTIAEARHRGQLTAWAGVLPLRAVCALRRGRLAEAAVDAADAVRLAEEVPGAPRHGLAPAYRILALTALARGAVGEAAAALDVPDAADRWGVTPFYGWYLDACGQLALAQDRPDDALQHFTAAGAVFEAGGGSGTFCGWRSGRALALHRLRRPADAAEAVAEATSRARAFGAPSAVGLALRTAARLEPDQDRAVALLEEADGLLRGAEARLEAARVAVARGAALRRSGRRRDARDPLRRGLEDARRCGATALAERATDELAASGATRPRMVLSGPDALTPSERRVAELVAAGRSNREVAEALVVSRKTVEVHLSSTYRKLQITGRGQLAAALAEEGSAGG